MKNIIIILALAAASFAPLSPLQISAAAQPNSTAPQAQKTPDVTLTPTVVVGDLVFIYNALNTIEIKGAEVDAFLAVQAFYAGIIKDLQTQNKQTTDVIQIKIPLATAQNTLTLMSRATLTGQNAVNYKRFQNSLVESAKNLTQAQGEGAQQPKK
ncbi:MAG: hypothetical protein ACM3U1_01270 [Chloroflexota bacterium]